MRLWSIHPAYLDSKGLVALWREALLAQAVLHNKTRGYRNHPQLIRFRQHPNPKGAIATYLRAILKEASDRGYKFDRSKIIPGSIRKPITVTTQQLRYEIRHLQRKLKDRDPQACTRIRTQKTLKPHPLFRIQQGPVASWEIVG
jgi:hypothetical protein